VLDFATEIWYYFFMNSRHRKTLEAIFTDPIRPDIKWADIESLFIACGGHIEEARGSRVCVDINGCFGHFHMPHPQPGTDRGAIKSVRRFLENAGVKRDEHNNL
jgi:hypothetical protein